MRKNSYFLKLFIIACAAGPLLLNGDAGAQVGSSAVSPCSPLDDATAVPSVRQGEELALVRVLPPSTGEVMSREDFLRYHRALEQHRCRDADAIYTAALVAICPETTDVMSLGYNRFDEASKAQWVWRNGILYGGAPELLLCHYLADLGYYQHELDLKGYGSLQVGPIDRERRKTLFSGLDDLNHDYRDSTIDRIFDLGVFGRHPSIPLAVARVLVAYNDRLDYVRDEIPADAAYFLLRFARDRHGQSAPDWAMLELAAKAGLSKVRIDKIHAAVADPRIDRYGYFEQRRREKSAR